MISDLCLNLDSAISLPIECTVFEFPSRKELDVCSIGSFRSDAYAADMTFLAKPVSAIADTRVAFMKPDKPRLIFEYFVLHSLTLNDSKISRLPRFALPTLPKKNVVNMDKLRHVYRISLLSDK
jgi:hypothetical protein